MMGKLPRPSQGLAARILTEVGFEDRLIGYRFHMRLGAISTSLYSFEEVLNLLNDQHPRMDFVLLEKWIREVMGDVELAERIKAIARKDFSDQGKTYRIRDLMAERLGQCK